MKTGYVKTSPAYLRHIMDYVDVRGIWPVYINGMIAIMLEGKDRDISVEDARIVVANLK